MSEQSTKDFLLSREGRPVLIGVIAMLTIFPLIGVYTYQKLYPSTEPEHREVTSQQRNAAGQSDVEAQETSGIRPDLTSENLAPEARAALEEFNQAASAEGRMGQPTPDDVVLIDVDETPTEREAPASATGLRGEQEQANGRTIIGYTRDGAPIYRSTSGQGRIIGYTNSGDPIYAAGSGPASASGSPRERRERQRSSQEYTQALIAEHEEYRQRRFAAAVELVNYESSAPSITGMSFARANGNGSGAPDPMRIQTNEDGTADVVRGESNGDTSGGACEVPLVRGGEIRYAKTDIALNTDYQGPVRLTFLEGNLRGYIGMGSFELNELGAKMKLKIDTLFDPDGQTYSVSGYVLDPDTTLWAMSSDVDYHIIYRYGGFGLGSVLSAFQVLAENRATVSETVTPDGTISTQNRDPDGKQVTWTVLGEFGEMLEESLRDNINRPITVMLDPGEEAGVLFEDSVCELNTEITQNRRAQEQREAMGFGDPLR